MTVTGTIKLIESTQTFDSGFTKRLMVITTKEQYPQDLPIEFIKDKTSLLDKLNVGKVVEVSINLRGSEYNGRYYASITGWKVDIVEDKIDVTDLETVEEDSSDLPF